MSIDPRTLVARAGVRPLPGQADHDYLSREQPVERSPDLARVLALPRRPPLESGARSDELIELAGKRWRLPDSGVCRCRAIRAEHGEIGDDCLLEANAAQARLLHEISVRGTGCGLLAVGSGKTFLDLMASMALADHGVRTTALIVPSGLQGQLVYEHRLLAEHWVVPSLRVDDEGYAPMFPGRGRVVVISYEKLGRPENSEWLTGLEPDAIVADEAHRLRNATAAVHKRVLRYRARNPWVPFIWWTGTPDDGKLEHCDHLFALTLGDSSPLPLDREVAKDWGRAVDARKICAHPGALFELAEPGEHVRRGLRRRIVDTLGVVATDAPSIDVRIELTDRGNSLAVPTEVTNALEAIRDLWVRPDGEELVDALEVAATARDVACGFFLYWAFPRGEPDAVIDEWFTVRKEWRKECRLQIRRSLPHLDSPALVERAAERHHGARRPGGPSWASAWWPEWARVRSTVVPDARVEWISDYLVRDAAAWARAHRGVVWYWRAALGEAVAREADLPLFPGGRKARAALLAEDGSRSVIASAKAHGTGVNGLQRKFADVLMVQAPGSGWEQTLGRVARPGQRADVVRADYYGHTDELAEAHAWALRRARRRVDAGEGCLLIARSD